MSQEILVVIFNREILSRKKKNSFEFLVVPSGTVFRLSGRILHISFLDQKGLIIPAPSEKWDTKSLQSIQRIKFFLFNIYILETKTNRSADGIQDLNILPGSSAPSPPATSPPSSSNIQYAVFCSSKEARVYKTKKNISMKLLISYI